MSAPSTTSIPNYIAGTWDIDASHSVIGFSVRHMMVSKVKGRFDQFTGELVTAERFEDSSVSTTIDATSISTGNDQRDGHIKSADFFEVETHPEWTFRSTGIAAKGDDFVLAGDLSIKGNTKPVELTLEVNGFGPDAWGGTRVGFTATTTINRSDFGVDISLPLDGGGVGVSEKVGIELEIEAVLRAS